MKQITVETSTGMKITTIEQLEKELAQAGIRIEQTISGYWRAMRGDDIFWDDSAADEAYSRDNATYIAWHMLRNDNN